MRSFRLRLAVVSAVLSATVLLAFGAGSWWLIRSARISQLNSELKNLAAREVGLAARGEMEWPSAQARMSSVLGVRVPADLAVLYGTGADEISYQSEHWPPDVLKAVVLHLQGQVGTPLAHSWNSSWWMSQAHAAPGGGGPGGGGGAGGGGGPGSGVRPGFDGPTGTGGGPAIRRPPPPRVPVDEPAGVQAPATHVPPAPPLLEPRPADARPFSAPESRTIQDAPAPTVKPSPLAPAAVASAPVQDMRPPEPSGPAVTAVAVPPSIQPAVPSGPAPNVQTFAVSTSGPQWRVVMASLPGHRLAIAVSQQLIDSELRGVRNGFLMVLPLALALVAIVSWWFAGRALQPLQTVIQASRQVTAEGLDRRIDARGQDHEFVELIDVFNRMLARLERSFVQANRFTADAAHELKTPLAIIQGQLERSLVQAQDNAMLQASLTSTLDEVQRLSSISRKLLLLAQADAGRLRVTHEPVDMALMLDELIEDARMLAPELHIEGRIQADLQVAGDATLLRQVLHNLLSNAIKYNLPGGWIRLQTARWGQRLEVSVANASHGIAAHERTRLFERFFRADPAHGRKVEGVGLGLSVSREIARAHGGDLVFKGDSGDGGVEFSLLLPLR